MRSLIAGALRRRPREIAVAFAVLAAAGAILSGLSWKGVIGDLVLNDRYTKAAPCTAAEARQATRAVEHCRTDLPAFVGYSERGGGADFPLTLEFDDGSTIIAELRSQSDFDAFADAPPVVATVWDNVVTTVRLSGTAYQTKDDPGTRIPGDVEQSAVLTLATLVLIWGAAVGVRAVQAQARLRAATAGIAQSLVGPDRDPNFPPGFGRPPETWGERPAQPGFSDVGPGETWQQTFRPKEPPARR